MSISLKELQAALNTLLRPQDYRDYCPNGLQIEGKAQINKLVCGVTASQAFINAAIDANADAILVHHGYFWQGESPVLKGIKKDRIHTLLNHEISLLAYHLPLDDHAKLGNNAQLAEVLDMTIEGDLIPGFRSKVGFWGKLNSPMSGEEFVRHIEDKLGRSPLHIPGNVEFISTIGWCTGGAQNYIEQAVECGVDAYLTGEVSEQTVHIARESGMHFFAAGHHATERYGVQAVGKYLAESFDVEYEFIDIDNPA